MGHKTTREHYEKYAALYAVAPKTFDSMALSILRGLCNTEESDPVEYLRHAYRYDPNLNNTFRGGWMMGHFANYDVNYDTTRRILKGHYGERGGFSLAENVCVIKHAMIYHILNLEPEYTEYSHVTSHAPADGVSGD